MDNDNPSTLDKILDAASQLGLGYLDYRIAENQAEAQAALEFQQTAGAQKTEDESTWGLGGSQVGTSGLPSWVFPAAFLAFGGVLVWKAVK